MAAQVTAKAFSAMFPMASPSWLTAINRHAGEFCIDSPARLTMFLAQIHHESMGLTRMVESFRYSAPRLLYIFPTHFRNLAHAEAYVTRGPHAIANHVYGGRMGNGAEASGDGYRYRGRGPIMLTGANNYREYGTALGVNLVKYPHLAAGPTTGIRIAARYWKRRGCNPKADAGDVQGVTRLINGGLNGLAQRVALWKRFQGVVGAGSLAA